jgi:hypothetical protein
MLRRRFKQTVPLEERLIEQAKRWREEAQSVGPGLERDGLIRKARQAEAAAHVTDWLTSPDLQPPPDRRPTNLD